MASYLLHIFLRPILNANFTQMLTSETTTLPSFNNPARVCYATPRCIYVCYATPPRRKYVCMLCYSSYMYVSKFVCYVTPRRCMFVCYATPRCMLVCLYVMLLLDVLGVVCYAIPPRCMYVCYATPPRCRCMYVCYATPPRCRYM